VTGFLLLIISAVSFIVGLFGGHFSDERGRKKTMQIGLSVVVIGYLIATLMNSPLGTFPKPTFIGFLLASAGFQFTSPAFEAMMIDVSTPENRQFVYSLNYWIINITVMIGAAIGGWFFRDYLFELMIVLILASVLNLSLVTFFISETRPADTRTTSLSPVDALKSYRSVFQDKIYTLFMVGSVCSVVIFMQPDYYLATHLGLHFKEMTLFGIDIYGQRMLSILTMTNTAMIVVLMAFMIRITKHFRLLVNFTVGAILQGIGFGVSYLVHDFAPLIIMMVVITTGEMILVPANQTIRADLMNPKRIGTYTGVASATQPIGTMVASLLVSLSHFVGQIGMTIAILIFTFLRILFTIKSWKMFEGKVLDIRARE
jgi:DHA1 family multidrug resistance protein B-like MFS transporter